MHAAIMRSRQPGGDVGHHGRRLSPTGPDLVNQSVEAAPCVEIGHEFVLVGTAKRADVRDHERRTTSRQCQRSSDQFRVFLRIR
jgi:hypothetical protein